MHFTAFVKHNYYLVFHLIMIMEEKERTIICETCEIEDSEDFSKDFSEELAKFPHILKYIEKLHEKLKLRKNEILELQNQLNTYEKEFKILKKNCVDSQTQTNNLETKQEQSDWTNDAKKTVNIVDQVTEAAESAMLQTGYVYEEATGLYYDYNSGYYYDAKSGLFYNGNTGIYYYYDKESKSYKFHSQIERESNQLDNKVLSAKGKRKKSTKNKDEIKKVNPLEGDNECNDVEFEEGECSESENEGLSSKDSTTTYSTDSENERDEDVAKTYPPCMRIIVNETNLSNLKVGSLFFVTYTGGSIGREGDHSVLIPDINISKHHATLKYNEEKKLYEIIDLGSRNGTFLNGKRLSSAKQESDPHEIVHGSILQLMSTKLLCHIHNGHETCGHCEPGLLQSESPSQGIIISTKSQHQSELKRLKNKFGIADDTVQMASRVAAGYKDRARWRRKYTGSSNQHAKTVQSSLNESVSKSNVGFKMLLKMGWSEGTSLGKNDKGIKEPVPLLQNINRAGFGTEDAVQNLQIDPTVEKKQAIWKKTQQRFNDITE